MTKIIKLLKRNPKKNQSKCQKSVFDICVVKKSSKGRFVYEKLGNFSQKNNHLNLNLFRLVFWISKHVALTGNVVNLFLKYNILNSKV